MSRSKSPPPPSFEEALAELERIAVALEGGQMTLEASLEAYRRGSELLQQCRHTLADAQQQVRILTEAQTLQEVDPDDLR